MFLASQVGMNISLKTGIIIIHDNGIPDSATQ
jgi:hypothetical protein